MKGLLRMADANANRAAEALRTLEDVARFVLGDGGLSRRAKALRHEVRAIASELDASRLAAARDSPGDPAGPGTSVDSRASATELAGAASSRLGESLRALEEALRVIRPALALRVERLRYDAYDASAAVVLALGTGLARQWSLCLLLTESLCLRPWREVLRAALEAGADCVQVREKSLSDAALLERVREVVAIARPFGVTVIVNDRADIAVSAGADGVHLGREDLPIRDARLIAPGLILGASTHDPDEARAAVEQGADYCGVGAMFATSVKPDREPSGPEYLRWFTREYPRVPHLAIGGVEPSRVELLVAHGCRGVAVSRAICGADDPGAVVRAMLGSLGRREGGAAEIAGSASGGAPGGTVATRSDRPRAQAET